MIIENFEVILWDFDGVIIDSNVIREKGFRMVLEGYPNEQIEELIAFHNTNGGWSRYVKFRYFYEEILKVKVDEKKIQSLSNRFSAIMLENLVNPNFLIEETLKFIDKMAHNGKEMHIVSGSDQRELRRLCKDLNISSYFRTINGSPIQKTALVKSIIKKSDRSIHDFCLVGDSVNDFEAARENQIRFFGFNNENLLGLDQYVEHF